MKSWQEILKATVDMRVEASYNMASAMNTNNVDEYNKHKELHKSGARIASKYRPKDGGA